MPQTSYFRWVPAPASIKRIGKLHALLYTITFGLIGARLDGLDILLLTTTGRKTGRARRVALPFFRLSEQTVLVASFGGSPHDPAWLSNLRQHPQVCVQRGFRRWITRARISQGSERVRLWAELTHEYPRYALYQEKTTRIIPLVVLESTPR